MKKAFTLTELVITIVIVGILTAVAIQRYSAWKTKYSIESDTKKLLSFIQETRTKAFYEKHEMDIELQGNKAIAKDASTNATIGEISLSHPFRIKSQVPKRKFSISTRGLLPNLTLYCGNSQAAYDCLVLSTNTIKLGKWNGQNCIQKF